MYTAQTGEQIKILLLQNISNKMLLYTYNVQLHVDSTNRGENKNTAITILQQQNASLHI